MNKLEQELKNIALSSSLYNEIISICNNHNLLIDYQGELIAETRDIIMGFKSSRDFIKNIQERLEIDENTAKAIATEVNQKVLEPIKEKLRILESESSKVETESVVKVTNPIVKSEPAVIQINKINPEIKPIAEKIEDNSNTVSVNRGVGESVPEIAKETTQVKKDYRVVNSTSPYGDINEIKIQKTELAPTPITTTTPIQEPIQTKAPSPVQIKKPLVTEAVIDTEKKKDADLHSKMMSDIEKAGDFVIEKDLLLSDDTSNESVKSIDREKLLNGIENPDKIDPIRVSDHLLGNINHSKENKIEIKKETSNDPESNVTLNKNMYTVDPYREAL